MMLHAKSNKSRSRLGELPLVFAAPRGGRPVIVETAAPQNLCIDLCPHALLTGESGREKLKIIADSCGFRAAPFSGAR